ncbi:hypothetical protein [Sphingomonas alpina]|uniref:Uncharacterized protein n=1 Tax=Sphingomonas alpina TaxID=653931 RepID=A0A7H0LKZ4_9SPHN|nr:hypothetical protein [Sphingomonas alpina]QNQ10347.1 hypothetical protein H3Z74_03665 [Sphingomonas alpina]
MADRLQEYRNRVSDAVDSWQANVCNPYIIAYNTAYLSYNETFKKQKESDKARAELFVSAAAILPGSILMATAANASLRVLANRVALHTLANRNLTRVLNVYQAIGASPTAMFAVGKVLDGVKAEIGKQIKDSVTKAMQVSNNLLATDPLNRDKQLNTWLTNHKLCAFEAADAIEHNRAIGDAEKKRMFGLLQQAPIANKPVGIIDPSRLALKIELGFYMMALLDSDELITTQATGSGGIARSTSKPIDMMPSDPKYPRSTMPSYGPGYVGSYQSVGISRPGGDVEEQIDKVHKQVRGTAFYAPSGWFGKSDLATVKNKELTDAEKTLGWLATQTSPLTPLGLRS